MSEVPEEASYVYGMPEEDTNVDAHITLVTYANHRNYGTTEKPQAGWMFTPAVDLPAADRMYPGKI